MQIDGSATLSANESIVYIGSEDHKLHAVHTADGTQKWAFATGGQVSAGLVFCGCYAAGALETGCWLCAVAALLSWMGSVSASVLSLSRPALCVCVCAYTGVLVSM